jgi:ABC-type multidrug transport system ATPase subunit
MTSAPSPEFAIDVQGLNKHFGDKHVVKDLSLRVERGEIFGFLGPDGSGKTTTIRMMCGLLRPDSGSGTCLGYDIVHESGEIKRKAGYMTQRFSFWEDLTIAENLDFVARMYARWPWPDGTRRSARRRIVRRMETAHGTRCLYVASTAAAAARRTHRGRRSTGAARFLGRNSEPCGERHLGSGEHALHG